MKTRFGKITLSVILVLTLAASVFIAFMPVDNALAASTWESKTFVIPNIKPGVFTGYSAAWVIFYNADTGDMYNASTGAVDTDFTDCDVDLNKHTSNTGVWKGTAPRLPKETRIGMLIYDSATPASSDIPVRAVLYDPELGCTYTDTNPHSNGRIFANPRN